MVVWPGTRIPTRGAFRITFHHNQVGFRALLRLLVDRLGFSRFLSTMVYTNAIQLSFRLPLTRGVDCLFWFQKSLVLAELDCVSAHRSAPA